jgi:hypothetical protein
MRSSLSYPCTISEVRQFDIPSRIEFLKTLVTLADIKHHITTTPSVCPAELIPLKIHLDQLSNADLEKTLLSQPFNPVDTDEADIDEGKSAPPEISEEIVEQLRTVIASNKPFELKQLSDLNIQLFFAKQGLIVPEDLPETITLSASYSALRLNFYELVKNSFDASASQLYLQFYSDTHQVEIVVSDQQKGRGFREGTFSQHFENLSSIDYQTIKGERACVSSSKTKRLSLGGAGKGLAMIDRVLQRYHGKLILESTETHPAVLRLISPISTNVLTPMSSYSLSSVHSPDTRPRSTTVINTPNSVATTSAASSVSDTPVSPMLLSSLSYSPFFSPSHSSDSQLHSYQMDTPSSQSHPLSNWNLNSPPASVTTPSKNISLLSFFQKLRVEVVEEEEDHQLLLRDIQKPRSH